ncbi:thiol:disulfide interchange protein DsbA/DsbL [Azonexus sp.]|uniref:thiol:disulfide interchange protein DsbA/DsbL n=1 Tax=Azonexus sp. TaxID=1872668 RepID=UPI0027BA73AA|nr:thiol:disulfide interchange protein DsbA/DsbL [Azonexus sp.]
MEFNRRRFVSSLVAFGATLTVAGPLAAQTAGSEFTLVTPVQPTDDPGKIEVVEFFSYGCPHCADFNPLLNAWAAKLPADVVLKKVPVSFGRAAWGNAAKLYHALEVTGEVKRLETDVFRAIHNERTNLFDERTITDWVAARGVDRKKFSDAFASFGVQSKVKRGDQMAQAFKIEGVPALAIDGKYLVKSNDFNAQLSIADKLIAKARSEKSGKK